MMKKRITAVLSLLLAATVLLTLPLSAAAEEAEPETAVVQPEELVPATETPQATEVYEEAPTEAYEEAPTEAPTEEPAAENYPKITEIQNVAGGVQLTWDSYEGNTIYRVYYRKAEAYIGPWEDKYGSVGWTRLATVKGNTYTHTGLKDAEIGIYTVRAVNANGEFTSDFNKEGWENSYYAAPEIDTISFDGVNVTLTWNQSWELHQDDNGECYRVYRRTTGKSWTRIASGTRGSYTDTTAAPGTTYIYTIRMTDSADERFLSGHTAGRSVMTYPVVTGLENVTGGVKLTWQKYDSAASYRVYYRAASGWTRIAQVSGTTYTDTSLKGGENRVYTVRALDSKNNFISDYNRTGWSNLYYASPEIETLSSTTEGVRLTWVRAEGAEDYRVYRKTTGGWQRLTQTDQSSYLDTTAVPGTTYTYTLRMISAEGERFMSYYTGGRSITYVAAPVIKSVTNEANGAKLTWDKAAGATAYRVYYKSDGGWTRIGQVTDPTYTDTAVGDGESREYTVRCVDAKGNFVSDFYRSGYTNTYFAPPVITSLTGTNDGVVLTWSRTAGAEDYRVYRKTAGASWVRLDQTDKSSYTDTTAQKGVVYTYTLRIVSTDGERFISAHNSGRSITLCDLPAFTSMTNGDGGVVLRWNAVKGASSYRIYYQNNGSWTRLDTVTGTTYTDQTAIDGESRVYTIRCVDAAGNLASDFSREGWAHTYCAPPALTAVTYKSGSYTVTWEEKPGAASYRVYRKTLGASDWTRIATVTENTYTDPGVTSGAMCAYTVRALDENGVLISYFVKDNPYYRNGTKLNGTLTVNGATYRFIDGQPLTGYYTESGTLYYYSNGRRAAHSHYIDGTYSDYYNRTQWLYELLYAVGADSGVSSGNSASVFARAKQYGIIDTYTTNEYYQNVTRRYAAQTMVRALGYPAHSDIYAVDVTASDSALLTLAYYGYFVPDYYYRLYPDAQVYPAEFDALVSDLRLYRRMNGKTVLSFGDSIMYGSGNGGEGVADMIAEKYGMIGYDYSVPGAVMGTDGARTRIPTQVRRAISAGKKADLILINGGTNDMIYTSLGSMNSGYDMSAIPEATYTDGFEKTMWMISENWKDTPVIYIRAHNMDLGTDSDERRYGNRGIEIAEKWRAAGIDLYNDSEMDAEIQSIRNLYTYYDPDKGYCDSIHPNALGYAVFYLPPVSEVLALTF